MAKLHHCDDGTSITDQVLKYQSTKLGDDYMGVYHYYNNYKDRWFFELKDHFDRSSFDSEYDFKLVRAVESFDEDQARILCQKYKWSFSGAFNRWFYAVLRNWKSNVKTSAFRQKKRPSVLCPVCGRRVPKIDENHLAHYKSKSDLPKAFRWQGLIYSVYTAPDAFAISWGKFFKHKLVEINNGKAKEYSKERVDWPWYTKEGTRGVMCPFTKKIVNELNCEYIKTLPTKFNRYARPFKWQEFIEEFSHPTLIQAEVYSLDMNHADDDVSLYNSISIKGSDFAIEYDDIKQDKLNIEYEHVFYLIETYIEDELDQKVLKLAAIGYSDEDIASALDIEKKDVRRRKKNIRLVGDELKRKLVESV